MVPGKRGSLAVALVVAAALVHTALPASAGQDFESNVGPILACGKWVFKIEDFGKEKMRNYFDYVPENRQALFTQIVKPNGRFFFNLDDTFSMNLIYPSASGTTVLQRLFGNYTQKGKKLKLRLNNRSFTAPTNQGIVGLEAVFAELVSNQILGDRDVVTEVPYVKVRQNKVRFKGRVKRANKVDGSGNSLAQLKMKMKARLYYDMRFMNTSEFADRFDGKGVFKMRFRTKDCDD